MKIKIKDKTYPYEKGLKEIDKLKEQREPIEEFELKSENSIESLFILNNSSKKISKEKWWWGFYAGAGAIIFFDSIMDILYYHGPNFGDIIFTIWGAILMIVGIFNLKKEKNLWGSLKIDE